MTKGLEPSEFVKGSEKVVEIFGCWPCFHDAEVVSMHLERRGRDKWEGPVLRAGVHVFECCRDEKARHGVRYGKHTIVNFRFGTVVDLELVNFNCQNVIFDLTFEEDTCESQEVTWEGPAYRVTFQASYGAGCSFVCASVEIDSVEETCPPGSVYA